MQLDAWGGEHGASLGAAVAKKLRFGGDLIFKLMRRTVAAETKKIKVVRPQMLIGWLLDMAVGSQDTPKGTHASEIHARAAQEARRGPKQPRQAIEARWGRKGRSPRMVGWRGGVRG